VVSARWHQIARCETLQKGYVARSTRSVFMPREITPARLDGFYQHGP
jgi:hypothetical protein